MQRFRLPHTDLEVSRLAYGCMNMGGRWDATPLGAAEALRAERLVNAAVELGINFFDHANIYALGKSEQVFGDVLKRQPSLRAQIVIQTKCGIRFADDPLPGAPGRYDFSYDHIVRAAEGSLRRLQTDTLDILLLHRPDPLAEPEEVARAFDHLHQAGKVRYFGVSNHTPGQIELLRAAVRQPLVANQLELNILHAPLIDDGVVANQAAGPYHAAAGTLDYCRRQGITVQAWAPVAGGRLIDPPARAEKRVKAAAAAVAQIAAARGVPREAVALAWLLRHPAGIQPIIGTTQPERLRASAQADGVALTREEWYALFIAGRGAPMP
jgi:predicted oxidoreductase